MARYSIGVISEQVFVVLDRLARGTATTGDLHERWRYVFGSAVEAETLNRLMSRAAAGGLVDAAPIPRACTLRGEARVVYTLTEAGRRAWLARREVLERALGVSAEAKAA